MLGAKVNFSLQYTLAMTHTVPNNSFGFWADLHLDGHVYGMADIHKY